MFKLKRYPVIALVLVIALILPSCSLLEELGILGESAQTTTETLTENKTESGEPTGEIVTTTDEQTTAPEGNTTVPEYTTTPEQTTEAPAPSDEINLTYKNDLVGYEATAPYAFVVDVDRGEIIYLKGDADAKIYPASTTKLVTAIVALEYCQKDTVLTVGEERNLVAFDSSVAGLKIGDALTLDSLIYCLLLPSGGDAAYTIAAEVGRIIKNDKSLGAREAVDTFVERMNEFLQKIGMKNSVFTCPDGYHDDGHYTTLSDMAKLGTYCVKTGDLKEYTSRYTKTVSLASGKKLNLKNSNALLNSTSAYYKEDADGLKTGTTDEAGCCLLASGNVKHTNYLVGVYKAESTIVRFDDAARAFDVLGMRLVG